MIVESDTAAWKATEAIVVVEVVAVAVPGVEGCFATLVPKYKHALLDATSNTRWTKWPILHWININYAEASIASKLEWHRHRRRLIIKVGA